MATIQQFDFSVDLLQAILWQYNDATRLQTILQKKQDWYNLNQRDFWQNWYDDVFNLDTANDFGLSVWAIILNIPLVGQSLPPSVPRPYWGFGVYNRNFNRGNFAPASGSITLTTQQKRMILKLRYYQLVSRGTVPETNAFIKRLFKDYGNVYVLDGLDMTCIYVFDFGLPSQVRFILDNYDLLPRPAAVKVRYRVTTPYSFGFGQYHTNFNNGNFIGES